MEQIDKHQQDWDKPINDNFAKFVKDRASSDVIYLNGASKADTSGFPLWWQCFHLGVEDLYVIQGYINLPVVKAGRKIDIFSIPGATKIEGIQAQLFDDFLSNTLYITKSDNADGTVAIHNSSATDAAAHPSAYNILIMCPNTL